MRMNYQTIINKCILLKSELKINDFKGADAIARAFNKNYLIVKINDVLDACIKKNRSDVLTAIRILKSYNYLLDNKVKKEALNGFSISY